MSKEDVVALMQIIAFCVFIVASSVLASYITVG